MEYHTREKTILRALSENSRTTVSEISKIANCSRVTAGKLVEKLTKELDIRFTLEIDPTSAGYLERHIMVFKFGKKPDPDEIAHILKDERFVLSAYLTDGNYDLVVYATATDPIEYIHRETVITEKLSDYQPIMKPSDIPFMSFGYMPLDNILINNVGSGAKLDKLDIELLKLLNSNSRISYSEMARELKVNEYTARYRVFNLKKIGIIKRFTIAVQKPPKNYLLTFFENFIFHKEFEKRSVIARGGFSAIDRELPLLSTFQLTAPITGSYGFFAMALFNNKEEAMKNVIRRHKFVYGKDQIEIKYARITRVLKGLLPFRNLDVSKGFIAIKWE